MTKTGGKGDKHSKICTRKGTRDRRIRLSANTAIRFYDVQDRLGSDRPSNVIDWLMKEAKAAIDELNAEHTHLLLQDLFLPDYSTPSVSEAFHRTPGDQTEQHLIQQQHFIEHCFNESQFANLRSRNSYFCSYPNSNELEGYEFVNGEPLQSSFQIPIADTDILNNGESGIWVEPEIRF